MNALKDLRKHEIEQVYTALSNGQSLLMLGEPGIGKTTLATRVQERLDHDHSIAVATYAGSAKETLTAIADQLGVDTVTDEERPKALTAQQLREALLKRLSVPKTLLIADDAHRWSASLRYWLEDVLRSGGLLLLLAHNPPPKDIFVRLPILELKPLSDEEIRELMCQEAKAHDVQLDPRQLAELQQKVGNNPALAQRIVRETVLGITELENSEHFQFLDGTPFLVGLITLLGVIRLMGLGLGDKALYVLGGILTLGALIIRSALYAANRGRRRL